MLAMFAITFSLTPWVILPTIALSVLLFFLRCFYMATARDIKRLEAISKSPVFSQLSTSMNGLTTVRAFEAEPLMRAEFDRLQDLHTSAWFAFISGTRWFALWLDWIAVVYLACVVYSFLVLGGENLGGDVGLAISGCMVLKDLQWGVRQTAEMESLMTSVERVIEYSNLQPEDLPRKPDKQVLLDNLLMFLYIVLQPPTNWPSEGRLEFKDVDLRYAEDEQFVLRRLSFFTEAKEKIGIVGRTGAGKSSLITALFRLAEPSGSIIIDGVEILDLGLQDLREKISIIPQEPVVFSGSLRRNLDPFSEHDDEVVWKVLLDVHLAETVRNLREGLSTEMSEGGEIKTF